MMIARHREWHPRKTQKKEKSKAKNKKKKPWAVAVTKDHRHSHSNSTTFICTLRVVVDLCRKYLLESEMRGAVLNPYSDLPFGFMTEDEPNYDYSVSRQEWEEFNRLDDLEERNEEQQAQYEAMIESFVLRGVSAEVFSSSRRYHGRTSEEFVDALQPVYDRFGSFDIGKDNYGQIVIYTGFGERSDGVLVSLEELTELRQDSEHKYSSEVDDEVEFEQFLKSLEGSAD